MSRVAGPDQTQRGRAAGYALIIMLALMTTLSMAYIGSNLSKLGTNSDVRAKRATLRALREAQTALIGYAAMEDNTPGTLPCPSPGVDGTSKISCYLKTAPAPIFGRLPWQLLGLVTPRDGAGQCLWYALSTKHRNQPSYSERSKSADAPAINPDTDGDLTLVTASSVKPAVAILLAPGGALGTQAGGRSTPLKSAECSGGGPAAFLEAAGGIDNAVGGPSFVDKPSDAAFNDTVWSFDQRKLLRPVLRRALAALAQKPVRDLIETATASSSLSDFRKPRHIEFDIAVDQGAMKAKYPALTDKSLSPTSAEKDYTEHPGACPTSVGKGPVGWLCVNAWYDKIQLDVASNSLVVALDKSSVPGYTCRMQLADGKISCGTL